MKNLTYKISMLILGLFFTAFAANAQQIKGVVTDTKGEPQIGVSIFVEGTTLGVASGIDGDYVIDIPDAKGKTLVFSMIGLAEKKVVIGNSTTINVSTAATTVIITVPTLKTFHARLLSFAP